jgi:hypothetical protein
MDVAPVSAAPQNGVLRTAQLLCASFAAMVLAACKPDPPEGISVICDSNGENFYTRIKPGPCPGAAPGTLPENLPEECLDRVDRFSIFKCYGKDEWLSGTGGDDTGGSEGAADGEGIDRYNWPTHGLSLAHIREQCSSECDYRAGLFEHVCEDANWDIYGYDEDRIRRNAESLEKPETLTCIPPRGRSKRRSSNSNVVQDEALWLSDNSQIELACLTVESCAGLFDVNIMRHLVPSSPALPGVDEAEAKHLLTTGAGSPSIMTLRFVNQDDPSEGSMPVAGHIEYTALDCGESTCPFYLGNLTVTNTSDTWDLHSEALGADVEITNLQVRLRGPTLGVWRPSTGEVYLDDQMLELRVDFDLAVAGDPAPTVTKYITNADGLFGIRHQNASIQLPNVVIREGDLEAFVTISYDTLNGQPPVFDADEQTTDEE